MKTKKQKQQLLGLIKKLLKTQWRNDDHQQRKNFEPCVDECIHSVRNYQFRNFLSALCFVVPVIMAMIVIVFLEGQSFLWGFAGVIVISILTVILGIRLKPQELDTLTEDLYEKWSYVHTIVKSKNIIHNFCRYNFWSQPVTDTLLAEFFEFEFTNLVHGIRDAQKNRDFSLKAKLKKDLSVVYELAKKLGFGLPVYNTMFVGGFQHVKPPQHIVRASLKWIP